jgi:hypothetical protein
LRHSGFRSPLRWPLTGLLLTLLSLLAIGLSSPRPTDLEVRAVAHVVEQVPQPPSAQLAQTPAETAVADPPTPEPARTPEPCAAALASVAAGGLPLPAGVDYQCPSTRFAHHGAACWDDWPCPGTAFIAINMSLFEGAGAEYLQHVVAHEICHIIDFRDRGWSSEPRADACAAEYGF